MSMMFNDVLLHIDETLDTAALQRLEESIRHDAGVVSVGHNPERNHIILVVYDSRALRAATLLHSCRERGLHAQVVGL